MYIQCIYAAIFGRREFQLKTRIAKWGNSLAVRIPKAFALEAGLADGEDVEIQVQDGRIVISSSSAAYDLGDLVEGITPENRHQETDWGKPTGGEVW